MQRISQMRALPLPRIVILSGRKRSMCEKPQPEQVGTEPKDLIPLITKILLSGIAQ